MQLSLVLSRGMLAKSVSPSKLPIDNAGSCSKIFRKMKDFDCVLVFSWLKTSQGYMWESVKPINMT